MLPKGRAISKARFLNASSFSAHGDLNFFVRRTLLWAIIIIILIIRIIIIMMIMITDCLEKYALLILIVLSFTVVSVKHLDDITNFYRIQAAKCSAAWQVDKRTPGIKKNGCGGGVGGVGAIQIILAQQTFVYQILLFAIAAQSALLVMLQFDKCLKDSVESVSTLPSCSDVEYQNKLSDPAKWSEWNGLFFFQFYNLTNVWGLHVSVKTPLATMLFTWSLNLNKWRE